MAESIFKPRILVFSTDKISDPGIDLAGLRKIHYSPTVYIINLPCSSSIKTRWIMHAFKQNFDGVFIAADGHECSFSHRCSDHTNNIIARAQELMKENNISPKRIRMAAICSVCAEPFANHMETFSSILAELGNIGDEMSGGNKPINN